MDKIKIVEAISRFQFQIQPLHSDLSKPVPRSEYLKLVEEIKSLLQVISRELQS